MESAFASWEYGRVVRLPPHPKPEMTMNPSGDPTSDLKLLSFNLWRGGVQVDFGRIVDAILASGADVVGLQEPEGATT